MNLRFPSHHAPASFDAHPELSVAGPRRRPHWINVRRVRTYAYAALIAELLFIAIYVVRLHFSHNRTLAPLSQDFTAIWGAASLAAHGHAADAWHPAALRVIQEQVVPTMHDLQGVLLWLYPPHMLLLMLPVGWLPYALATTLWLGATYALFVLVMRGIAQRSPAALCAAAFPAAFLAIVVGQTSLMTAAVAGLGLMLLQRRPVIAGICFGILTVKPQLAMLFPFALLCAGQWRALGAWAATVAGTAALATLAFGPDSWLAFTQGLHLAYQAVSVGHAKLDRMPTLYAMATLAGLPEFAARGLQALSALAAVAAVGYAWRGSCAYALRAATLACASLLVSPYLYDYDLTWLGIVIAWYARHAHTHGWRRFDREWLAMLWATPLACLAIVGYLHVQFVPLVTLGSLAVLIACIAHERSESPRLPDTRDTADEVEFTRAIRLHRATRRLDPFSRPLPLHRGRH